MRLFEKILLKKEISPELQSPIKCDQFAYKEGTSATDALIMCHHKWLNWLDNNADHVRVVSFDLKKAFDSVSHNTVCKKLEKTKINPYIINWIANFLSDTETGLLLMELKLLLKYIYKVQLTTKNVQMRYSTY